MKKINLLNILMILLTPILTIILLFGVEGYKVARAANGGVFTVESKTASAGETLSIDIVLSENPGIVSAYLKLDYDTDRLTLTEVTDAKLLNGAVFGNDYSVESFKLTWDDSTASSNNKQTGTVAILTFQIKDSAPSGEAFISLSDYAGIINFDLETVEFSFISGAINVVDVSDENENNDTENNENIDIENNYNKNNEKDTENNNTQLDDSNSAGGANENSSANINGANWNSDDKSDSFGCAGNGINGIAGIFGVLIIGALGIILSRKTYR